MINKNNLFENERLGLLCPYTFEFLNILIGQLGYNQEEYDDLNVKQDVLNILKEMLDLGVIEVHDWLNNPLLNKKEMSSQEIINEIDSLWVKGIQYPDFYAIALFGAKDWYLKKLEDLGMTNTTDWHTFVKNKIGDLQAWIESNRL